MQKDEVLKLINQVSWYHSFEILPGLIIPGRHPADPKGIFQRFGLGPRLDEKRVLRREDGRPPTRG